MLQSNRLILNVGRSHRDHAWPNMRADDGDDFSDCDRNGITQTFLQARNERLCSVSISEVLDGDVCCLIANTFDGDFFKTGQRLGRSSHFLKRFDVTVH